MVRDRPEKVINIGSTRVYFALSRCLSEICIYSLVSSDAKILHKTNNQYWPSNLYPVMLSEAIYQREAQAIEWLVSTWPMKCLRVFEVIPLEDYLEHEYLTLPIEGNEQTCLVDYFILGLLRLKPEAGLKDIDFTGFEKGRFEKNAFNPFLHWILKR